MKKKAIAALLVSVLTASIATGCGSEYKQAYDDFQKQVDEQAAEMQKEIDRQVDDLQSSKIDDSSDTSETAKPKVEDSAKETETPTEEEYPKEVDGINVTFYESVLNDKTGNWRLAVIYDGSDLNTYVADFYKAYVKDDAEVFGIVNLGLKTTAHVSKLYENWLDVTVTEYQDGEEHDAEALFGGMELDHYWIDMETGEIDNLED